MIIILSLSCIIILFACYYYTHHLSKSGRLINLIPGPPCIPFVGNILDYQGSPEELWGILRKITDTYYPILRIWSFFTPVVSIRHPDDLETILSSMKHIDKSRIYDILLPWFGTGLLTSGGAKWHARRKILTPAFHFHIIQQFVEILIEESDRMTKSLQDVKGPVVKNLVSFLSEHTLNAICETAMGTSLQGLAAFQQKYRKTVHQMGLLLLHRLVRPWLHPVLLFALSPTAMRQRKFLRILHGFTDKIIAERKLYHDRTGGRYLKIFENDKMTDTDDTEFVGIRKKRLAMLDLLIAASRENHITDVDIREEVDTFMFEGHDTTAMAICFVLLLLAENKDIQDRVRAEVDSVMQKNGERFTMASLQKLPYMDRCLKEALRLYPSVHFISRITSEDTKLQSFVVPAGTILHLNIFSVHRDPNFWSNPDVFDPDRFLPERSQNRHPYSYLPFSAGPRNCIGQRFAMLEMKAMIAPLLYNFHVEPIDYLKDIQLKTDLVLRSAHPLRVRFVPVQNT